MKLYTVGAIAIAAALCTISNQASAVSFDLPTAPINGLGTLTPGVTLDFSAAGTATGINNDDGLSAHYDYVFSFTLSSKQAVKFNYSGGGEEHTVVYNSSPYTLAMDSDPGVNDTHLYYLDPTKELGPTNEIDIGQNNFYTAGGFGFDNTQAPAFYYGAGTYYLRLFGTTDGSPVTLSAHLASALAPAPIPAALPLFASALLGLGFVGYRRSKRNGMPSLHTI
jgi:hypothetical protein